MSGNADRRDTTVVTAKKVEGEAVISLDSLDYIGELIVGLQQVARAGKLPRLVAILDLARAEVDRERNDALGRQGRCGGC